MPWCLFTFAAICTRRAAQRIAVIDVRAETRTRTIGGFLVILVIVFVIVEVDGEAGRRLHLLDGDDGQDALLPDAEQPRQPPRRPPAGNRCDESVLGLGYRV